MSTQQINSHLYGPGITRITVTGFKSLASKTDVEIRPLTILAGANSSGKSSLMQPILLMKQTLDNERIPPGPFWLWGDQAQYTTANQFLSRILPHDESSRKLTVEIAAEASWTELIFEKTSDLDLTVVETSSRGASEGPVWRLNRGTSQRFLKELFDSVAGRQFFESAELKIHQDRCFLAVGTQFPGDPVVGVFHRPEVNLIRSKVQQTLYVSGLLRGSCEREFYLHGLPSGNVFPGDFEDYVPSILEAWREDATETGYGIEKLHLLRSALQLLELASDVQTRKLNESQVEVRIPRTLTGDTNDLVSIADVGLTVSQVLPVLVALIIAHPNQLVHIEQPELHLHPRAQWRLAQLLADAANRGVRLVIETHSSLLLRGILTEIAKGKISNDKVILHWFERDKRTGISTVSSKEPDSAGRVGEWPEDFSDVELESDNDYLNAVESKLFAAKQ